MSSFRNIAATLSDSSNSMNWLIFCIGFLMYANTLPNGYKYGDELVATGDNVLVSQGLASLPTIFTETGYGWLDFHPLAKASFALEHAIVGEYYLVSNYVQLILFASVCLVFFLVLNRVFSSTSPTVRLLAVLLFIVHPVNGIVVNSMLGRAHLLGFLFIGLTILSIVKWMNEGGRKTLLAVCLFSVLALFSNAEMIVWFLVPVFIFSTLKKKPLINFYPILGTILIGVAIYGLCRQPNVGDSSILAVYNPLVELPDFESRLPTALFLLFFGLKLLVFPITLVSDYGFGHFEIMDWSDLTIYISIVVVLVLTIASVIGRHKRPLLALGAFIVIIDLVPFSNVFSLQQNVFDEKSLFGASLGVSLIFASLIGSFFKLNASESIKNTYLNRPGLRALFSVIFVLASYQTFSRNFVWANNYLLTTTEVELAENSAILNFKCGKYLRDEYLRFPVRNFKAHLDSAAYYLERSIFIYDKWPVSLVELAELRLWESRQPQLALDLFEKALIIDPANKQIKLGMAAALAQVGRAGDAIEVYGKILEMEPNNLISMNGVVSLYLAGHYLDEAEYANQRFFQLHPNSYKPFMYQGQIFLARKDTSRALSYLNDARSRNQNDPELNRILQRISNPSSSSK